jgi:hypothetical protein
MTAGPRCQHPPHFTFRRKGWKNIESLSKRERLKRFVKGIATSSVPKVARCEDFIVVSKDTLPDIYLTCFSLGRTTGKLSYEQSFRNVFVQGDQLHRILLG